MIPESELRREIERLDELVALLFRRSIPIVQNFKQSLTIQVVVNTTTASVVFVPLLSITLTKISSTSVLIVLFSVATSNLLGAPIIFFRVRLDGVAQRGMAISIPFVVPLTQPGAIVLQLPGAAVGVHTVDVQWRVSAGTAQIRPVAAPDAESAILIVQEVEPL